MQIELYDPQRPIDRPGFYRMDEAVYHSDPCAYPSLSASLIKKALPMGKGTGSMRHLLYAHPKLAPIPLDDETPTKASGFGSCFHKLILNEGPSIVVVDAPDWRTNDAKEKRDLALKNCLIPVLTKHFEQAKLMEVLVREQIAQWPDLDKIVSGEGAAEVVAVWTEDTPHGTIWCRALIDWLPFDGPFILDWKTTDTSASPEDFGRYLYDQGADIQASFYARGVKALTGREMAMLFPAVEQYIPHSLAVHRIDHPAMQVAKRKIDYVIETYAACLAADVWPGYMQQVAWQEMPPWHERKFIEAEDRGATSPEGIARMIEGAKLGERRTIPVDAETAADFGIEQ